VKVDVVRPESEGRIAHLGRAANELLGKTDSPGERIRCSDRLLDVPEDFGERPRVPSGTSKRDRLLGERATPAEVRVPLEFQRLDREQSGAAPTIRWIVELDRPLDRCEPLCVDLTEST
jgi:hypothetical protein